MLQMHLQRAINSLRAAVLSFQIKQETGAEEELRRRETAFVGGGTSLISQAWCQGQMVKQEE